VPAIVVPAIFVPAIVVPANCACHHYARHCRDSILCLRKCCLLITVPVTVVLYCHHLNWSRRLCQVIVVLCAISGSSQQSSESI